MKNNLKKYLISIIILAIVLCTIPVLTNNVQALTYEVTPSIDSIYTYWVNPDIYSYDIFTDIGDDGSYYYKVGNLAASQASVFNVALKFDISAHNIDDIRIVKLKLYIQDVVNSPSVNIYGTSNDTWYTKYGAEYPNGSPFPLKNDDTELDKYDTASTSSTNDIGPTGGYQTFDVTDIAKDVMNPVLSVGDCVLSLVLTPSVAYDSAQPDSYFSFNSMEGINPPTLEVIEYSIPTVTTQVPNENIGTTTATINCNITDDGGKTVTAKGIEYKKSTNSSYTPATITDSGTAFSAALSGLESNTEYIARGYATNEYGTAYSSEVTFTTDPPTAGITPSEALTENNLDTSCISVALNGTTFVDDTLPNESFTLNNAPAGLSIERVDYISSSSCNAYLAYDGTDFDTTVSNLSITIAGEELSGGAPINSSNSLIITAHNEAKVLSVTNPADGIYKGGETINFSVNFDNPVNVIGTPYITLSLSTGATVNAVCSMGSGTSSLIFTYEVLPDQAEASIISIGSTVILDGGTIKDLSHVDAELPLSGTASTTGIMLDGKAPVISSLSPGNTASDIQVNSDLTLTFDESVTNGTGNIAIYKSTGEVVEIIAATSANVTVSSNTVTINPLNDFLGETQYYILVDPTAITDLAGNSFAGIAAIDAWSFTTKEIIPPGVNSFSPADGAADVDKASNLTITFSEIVVKGDGKISLINAFDSSTVNTEITGWGTDILTINPANDLTELNEYYVLIDSNAIKDAHGNYYAGISDFTAWNFTVKDSTPPAITSVSTPSVITYKAGDDILITCTFNEAVDVTAGGSIKLNIGEADKYALYDSKVSSKSLQYKYTVETNVNDNDGIAIISLDGSYIKDLAGNSAVVTLNGISDTSGIIIDGTAPTIDDNNSSTVYNPMQNKLILKITENQGFGSGLGSSAVDVSKFTVKDGLNSRTLTVGQSTAVITDSSTITITIGGTDLTAIEAFASGEKISSVSEAAGGIIDAAGNICAADNDNVVSTQAVMSISEDAPLTEGTLDARYIIATLYGTKFVDDTLGASNFDLINEPAGVQIKSVVYKNSTECWVYLQYDGRDFDTNIPDLGLSILAGELACSTSLTSQNNLAVTATNDAESLTISGTMNEGLEDTGTITADISGGTFNTITPANWTVANLPQGVTVESISKADINTVTISLQGNRTKDYDTDIMNVSVSCKASEFLEADLGVTELTANTGVMFNAVNDSESMSITASSTIKEREESGKVINVTVTGGLIESTSISDWTVNNLPLGVTIGTITKTSTQTVDITLQGNSTEDYDVDKSITVTCTGSAYSDSAGATLTSNSISFIAKLDPVVVTDSTIESLTKNSVTIKGNVTSVGNDTVLERGIEYKKSTDSSFAKAAASTADTGLFSVNLTALKAFTAYDARAYVRTGEGTAYGAVVHFTTEKTNNADLGLLIISSGTITFNPATTDYSVNLENRLSAITVTPTASEPTALITVNGIPVNSGESSQPINLTVGRNEILIVVTTDNGTTTKTYKLVVIRAAAPSNPEPKEKPGPKPAPIPVPAPNTSNNGLSDIIINGIGNKMASANTGQVNGTLVTTVQVDNNKLNAYLNNLTGQSLSVVLPVNTNADKVVWQLSGAVISSMAERNAMLEVKTPGISYSLPLTDMNLQEAMQEFGPEADLNNVVINIGIAQSDNNTCKIVGGEADKNNYTIVVKPIEFEVNITWNGKTIRVNKFSGYVERTVAIPEGIDPAKITTGVIVNSDGTFSHVPTTVIEVGGRYFAKINSLTNSTYSVIWNELSFKDMEGHWAKDDVNDLGSRLIITGADKDTFSPAKEITRAEFASIAVKALGLMRPGTGKQVFSDVANKDWYFDAVSIANEYGIVKGYNGAFRPKDKITREEAMTMLSRAMSIADMDINLSGEKQNRLLAEYYDGSQVSAWAKNSVAACLNSSIVTGADNKILPRKNITRVETAVMVRRMLKAAGLI